MEKIKVRQPRIKGRRKKNTPVLRDELKARRAVTLTATAWANIRTEAARQNVSASELIEEWGRTIPRLIAESLNPTSSMVFSQSEDTTY